MSELGPPTPPIITLYCTALSYTALPCTALQRTALYNTAIHCNDLNCALETSLNLLCTALPCKECLTQVLTQTYFLPEGTYFTIY